MHLPLTLLFIISSNGCSGKEEDSKQEKKVLPKNSCEEGHAWRSYNFQEFNLHVCLQKYSEMDVQGCSPQIIYIRNWKQDKCHSRPGYINHGLIKTVECHWDTKKMWGGVLYLNMERTLRCTVKWEKKGKVQSSMCVIILFMSILFIFLVQHSIFFVF